MRGNQAMLNTQVFNHPDNPIKEKIGDKDAMLIIYTITDEYWKEWRRQLTNSTKPHVYAGGVGEYSLIYGKSKSYLRKMLGKIRSLKERYPDTYTKEGTRANGMYTNYVNRFRNTWKQVNEIKKEVNYNLKAWRDKKIAKYGDKAIL